MVIDIQPKLVADLIADFLESKGIDTAFGIIGSANSYIFDSIAAKGFTKIIYTHHEQAAAIAAGAYYRTCGEVAACLVTAGAGAANAITGVLSNWADSIPCLVISGQESSKYLVTHDKLRMYGTQGFNIINMVKDIVKYGIALTEPKDIINELNKCYSIAISGRPGPTWIDLPMDVQSAKVLPSASFSPFNVENNSENFEIEKVTGLISEASRPVIIAGHGIKLSNSCDIFRKLVQSLKIPVICSWSAINVLSYNNPYYFGCSGLYGQRAANFIVQNSDLLIVIGSRLALPQTGYNFDNYAPDAKIIMVNNDEQELNKYDYDIQIKTNCKDFIETLLNVGPETNVKDWHDKCIEYKKQFPLVEEAHKNKSEYENSYVFVNKLSKKLKDDHIIVIGQGSPLPCCHQAMEFNEKQTVFSSNGLGEMGNGLPAAIGAAIARDNKEVLLLDGDGSMMMNLQELQTITGNNLPIKIIVFNNQGYLFIKHTQKMLFNGRYNGVNTDTGLTLPDFRKIAKAFGFKYFSSLNDSIDVFLNELGPAIFDFWMNPEQDLIPKVKGILTNNGILAPPIEEMSPLLDIDKVQNAMININPISLQLRNL